MQSLFQKDYNEIQKVFQDFWSNPVTFKNLENIVTCIVDSLRKGGKIISCGNGGSMTDAMHFAEELTGKYRENRPAIPAIAISDQSYLSCVSNDYGYTYSFSRFIEAIGNQGDILFAISTSGKSENIVEAIKVAKQKQMKIIVLTGNDGGTIIHEADCFICVPFYGYADRIQEIHIQIIHTIIHAIEHELFEKK